MRLEFLENGPIRVEGKRFVVRVGEKEEALERPRVFLCRCGGSGNKPFCDGSHKGSSFAPKKFTAEKSGDAWLCQCKQTKNAPYCDGSHKGL